MFRSKPIIDRTIDFFTLLPKYYLEMITFEDCNKSRLAIAIDLLELFFSFKTFPDHYGQCRLWEIEKAEWKFYYGSNYHAYQRSKLQRKVQPTKYVTLFDDKLVCELLCRGIGVNVPHTYGIISPDEDYQEKIESWFHNSPRDALIIKPLRGCGGRDIFLAKKTNKVITIQSKVNSIPLQDYELMEEAIVQEVLEQDTRMSRFAPSSVNTIRIVTMYTKKNLIIVLGAMLRCGIGASYVDNTSAGGIGVGINHHTGQLNKYAFDKKGHRYAEHPTSKMVFKDCVIPEWNRIIDVAVKIQQQFPFYRILGMDIALNKNGEPVIIEVNDCPDLLGVEQKCGPLFKVEQNLLAFGEYDLFVNRHQRKLYANLDSNAKGEP